MKKTTEIALIAAAVVAFLVLAAAIAVSPLAKNYIEKHDHELLGRTIRMERLRMNIFTGTLRVQGLRIGSADDTTHFFTLDSLDLRMRLLPLLSHRVIVRRVHLARPDIEVYQQGDAFSFDDLLERFASDTAAAPEPIEPARPWEIGIYDIAIRNGHILYKDLALDATWGLNDVNLRIPGVYFGGEKTDVGAVLNFAEGGSLATQVAYDLESSEFDIGLRLRDLGMAGLLPYFRQSLDLGGVRGRLSADVRLRGSMEHLLALRTEGWASLAGFELLDAQQRPVAGVDTLGVQLAAGDLEAMRFRFDRIYVGGFSALAELTPAGDNLTALMKPAAEAAPASEQAAAQTPEPAAAQPDSGPQVQIADLEIADGRFVLRDLTLERPFEYTVSGIRMRSRNFDPTQRNRLQVDARMQRTGSARLRWEGALNDMDNQSITLWLQNIDLKDFSPYCELFTAYPLRSGNLTFRSQNVIRNRYLDGTNHLDAYEPDVASKRKDLKPEMNLPLKLGLYVLKDRKGHVQMDLPVGGNLDSPEFSYRKIVLRAIGNLLLKVVSAPFSFLSGDSDRLEYIALDAGQVVFTSEQYAAFDRIARMLHEKPDMQVVLTQRVDLARALPDQTANALRMAYHNSLAEADSTGRRPRLTMLEYEKLQQIDIRTPEVEAFADAQLAARGLDIQGSPATKALALYREQALEQLRRIMDLRDKALENYMRTTHNLQAPAFQLRSLEPAEAERYKGRDRYTIAIGLDGETVEIGAEQEEDEAATAEEVASGTPAEAEQSASATQGEQPAAAATPATPQPEPAAQVSPQSETAAAETESAAA